ncbi:MAG: putative metal-binding motif-containing protein, partial [Nanoarchaeota archaeon]|nr:putative metal-binding motif-containing protein [Nanoarchaeota archaeon]
MKRGLMLRIIVLAGIMLLSVYITGCASEVRCEEDNILGGGPLEKGRCAMECSHYGDPSRYTGPSFDMRCNHIFPGDRGNCPAGEVCTPSCKCQMVDKDFDGYFEVRDAGWLDNLIRGSGRPIVPDCDGTNSMINPGAAEVCNGIDDDCSDGSGGYDSDPETGIDDGDVCKKTVYLCMEESRDREITYPFSCKNNKEWCHSE